MASLSPLFRMCSGGRIRLFISSRYWWEQGAGGERNKGRQGVRTKKTSEWERKWIKSSSAYPWIKFNTHIQPITKHDAELHYYNSMHQVNTKLFDWGQHTFSSNIILRRGLLLACVCTPFINVLCVYSTGYSFMTWDHFTCTFIYFFYNNTRTHGPPPLGECIKESTGSSKGITAPTRSAS